MLVVGGAAFAAGASLFATAIWKARATGPGLSRLVVAALIVMAGTRFVPLSTAQFYLQSLAAMLALWPLAYVMWAHPVPPAPRGPAPSRARCPLKPASGPRWHTTKAQVE